MGFIFPPAGIVLPAASASVVEMCSIEGRDDPMTTIVRNMRFRVTSEPEELAQVSDLNYRTFVEEIPRHVPDTPRWPIDFQLDTSTLYVCLDGNPLTGMTW